VITLKGVRLEAPRPGIIKMPMGPDARSLVEEGKVLGRHSCRPRLTIPTHVESGKVQPGTRARRALG